MNPLLLSLNKSNLSQISKTISMRVDLSILEIQERLLLVKILDVDLPKWLNVAMATSSHWTLKLLAKS